jgi:glycosyltransferase involved in cell wall biosynthesis
MAREIDVVPKLRIRESSICAPIAAMRADPKLRILQVSTIDCRGGAALVAWNLFAAYRQMGQQSRLVVSIKTSADPEVIELAWRPHPFSMAGAAALGEKVLSRLAGRVRGAGRLRSWCHMWQRGWRTPFDDFLGYEDFNFPGSRKLLQVTRHSADILHCHELQGGYFDLRILPKLCRSLPVVLTLHDAWLLSGHCSHSFDCMRWQTGCGQCPDLSIFPAIQRDATASNWRRKRRILARSRLYLATPSRWLRQRIEASILAPAAAEIRVIPNGINLDVFKPAEDRNALRARLGIEPGARLIVIAAVPLRSNAFKDYATFHSAIGKLDARWSGAALRVVVLGETASSERVGNTEIRFDTVQQIDVAAYLSAADLYVHAARIETFPNAVIEALACGTPVVASAVGGIPEQIEHAHTGFLVPAGDAEALATRIEQLLHKDELRAKFGAAAASAARERFDLRDQAKAYLSWYQEIRERPSPS